jgi:nitrite reductase (NO-forming)
VPEPAARQRRDVPRIEIGTTQDDPRVLGRPIMKDHNTSALVWATAALLAVPTRFAWDLGWWLPLHLALLGAASQAVAGGQTMFSATLGLSRGPARRRTLAQLAAMNAGALLVIGGRAWDSQSVLATGAGIFTLAIGWVSWDVHRLWRGSVNRRFAITGTFYRLAGLSIIIGASIGGALGVGAFDDPTSYLEHKNIHMSVNVFGWTGLTIVGTAITLLPTIMHVRAASLGPVRFVPALMFGGLMVLATGASLGQDPIAGAGMALYVAGLVLALGYVKRVWAIPRRRKVPTAAQHLTAALLWAAATAICLVPALGTGDISVTRDLLVIGGAGGFVIQALLGAWHFLLPSTGAPIPEKRRRELIAMEVGGRMQVAAYNAGLLLVLIGLRTDLDVSVLGIVLAWAAAAFGVAKCWLFPLIAKHPRVKERSDVWWAEPTEVR